ncbi:MAG TPA: acetolactate synthase small subunit [Syntrophales bacterium]|nr:acetolactate synthase small subunit [Syntrophales bacterium]HPQ42615.1 acetolactate synthase small subunit [Syntrophales bacterium]
MEVREHTISLLVNNKPDVLARIAGTFSGRGYNIENISANVMMDPNVTKITIVTMGNTATVTQIQKQLKKLIDVIKVSIPGENRYAQREMALVKLRLHEADMTKLFDELKCREVVRNSDYCVVEITGDKEEIDQALTRLDAIGIDDVSRSGVVTL